MGTAARFFALASVVLAGLGCGSEFVVNLPLVGDRNAVRFKDLLTADSFPAGERRGSANSRDRKGLAPDAALTAAGEPIPLGEMAARVRSDNLRKSLIELKARLLVATANQSNALAKLSALEKNQDAVRLLQLPVSNANRHHRRPRLRSYQRRAVTVFAPSNDNLATMVATSTAATSVAE